MEDEIRAGEYSERLQREKTVSGTVSLKTLANPLQTRGQVARQVCLLGSRLAAEALLEAS